jgi:AcrR family transcriptional regulator
MVLTIQSYTLYFICPDCPYLDKHIKINCIGNFCSLKSFPSFVPEQGKSEEPNKTTVQNHMETQERILETSFSLFRQYGTRSITMDDIAQKLGASKKTLYAHFADKDELVVSAISRYLNQIDTQSNENQQKATDAIDEMFLVMQMLDECFRYMNPIILFDLQRFHPRAFQVFQDYKNGPLQLTIKQNLERGISEGLYRAELDIDVMTQYRVATTMLCFQPDLFPPAKYEMGKVQLLILEHYLYGVVSEEGYKRIVEYRKTTTAK